MNATSAATTGRILHQIRCDNVNKQSVYRLEASPNGNVPSGILVQAGWGDGFVHIAGPKSFDAAKDSLAVWTDKAISLEGQVVREKNDIIESDEVTYLTDATGAVKNVAPGLLGITTNLSVEGRQVVEEMSYLLTK